MMGCLCSSSLTLNEHAGRASKFIVALWFVHKLSLDQFLQLLLDWALVHQPLALHITETIITPGPPGGSPGRDAGKGGEIVSITSNIEGHEE